MKDFFYGGVHKKRGGAGWMDEYEEELAIKKAKEFSKGMTMERIRARLAEMDAQEAKALLNDDDVIIHILAPKEHIMGLVRKYFPQYEHGTPAFNAKVEEIVKHNKIKNRDTVLIGQRIEIPITKAEREAAFEAFDKKDTATKIPHYAVPLPSAKEEKTSVESIAKEYNQDMNALNAFSLSEKEVKKAFFDKNHPYWHIITHGKGKTKDMSAVLLTQESDTNRKELKEGEAKGYLTTDEISRLPLNNVELVFVNACEAVNDYTAEELKDVDNITRAFMKAGAKQTIGSFWLLDDAFALEFAKEFYKNLFDEKTNPNKDIPFALRETQVNFLKGQVDLGEGVDRKKFSAPYFWASRQYLGKQYSREKYLDIPQRDLKPTEAVVEIIRPKTEKDTYCVKIKTQKIIQTIELGNEEDIQRAVNFENNVIRNDRIERPKIRLAFFEEYWKPIDAILQSQNILNIYFAPSGAFLHGSRGFSADGKISSDVNPDSPYTINLNAFYDKTEKKYLIEKYNIIYLY